MSLKLISNNAYRLLGVVATASKKDIERNKSKFNAFLRVNRPVPIQPLDFSKLLTEVQRDLDTISKAESEISIPIGQLTHGMFWFVSTSHVDEECFQSLSHGIIDEAIDKWKSDGEISSLQNILVCLLIERRYREAILLAQNIYTVHFAEWKVMYSLLSDVTSTEVSHLFLDNIYSEIPKEISSMNWNGLLPDWETYIKQKSVLPISDKITSLVEQCKKANGDNPKMRYQDAFILLEKTQPLLNELETLLKPDDITLQSLEDKVYSEVLNCSISSYNAVYDELNSGDDSSYRQIAPRCNDLANRIDPKSVSPSVAKRIAENRKIINEKCNNIEKTIEEHLAFNDQICWFCGANGSTHEYKKPYSYSVSEPTWNGTKTTTYTKTVTLHICDDCQNELDERIKWNSYTAAMIFVVVAAIVLIFFDFWMDFEFWGWVFTIAVIGIGSIFIGSWTSNWVRQWLDKENIRVFKREIDDHPLVKMVKSEGYS